MKTLIKANQMQAGDVIEFQGAEFILGEVKSLDINTDNAELNTTVHIGELETISSIDLHDLSLDYHNAVLAIIANHVENMDTSALLNILAR